MEKSEEGRKREKMKRKILIVGGVAGGASAAAKARRIDETQEIIIFEKGQHISFASCGLPYYISDEIKYQRDLLVWTPESFARFFNVDTKTGHEVLKIYPQRKEIEVKELKTERVYHEKYDKLILAPGTVPYVPECFRIDCRNIFLLRTIPDAERIKEFISTTKPQKVAVVGAGFIGLEITEALARLGLKVTLVEVLPQVFPAIDSNMATIAEKYIRSQGVDVLLSKKIKMVAHVDGMANSLEFEDGAKLPVDFIILATGVRPNTSLAVDAGLEIGPKGGIRVNEKMQTSEPDIFACGDAVEKVTIVTGEKVLLPLASPAQREGRVAGANASGGNLTFKGVIGTFVVRFFDITIAKTGINEKEARTAGIKYFSSYTHSPNHAGYYPGAEMMTVKLLVEQNSGRLLGAQIIGGVGVDKRIDVFSTAIYAKMTVEELENLELGYTPPFSSAKDPVIISGMAASNIKRGEHQIITPQALSDLISQNGNLQIIDVRSKGDFSHSNIPGSISIPLDELRERIKELDPKKETVVYCAVGYRSYLAYKILKHHGFKNIANLSGGYTLWGQLSNFE